MSLPDVNHIKVIEDLEDQMYDLLKQQFKDKDNLQKLHSVIASMKARLQEETVKVAELRLIDTASGVVLDDIGKFVGVSRGSSTDEDYRTALKIRINRKRTHGTRSEIIDIISRAAGIPETAVDVYTGANRTVDIAFFAGCVEQTGASEIAAMLPLSTNHRLLSVVGDVTFSMGSIHGDPVDPTKGGYGSVLATIPPTSGRIASLLSRSDLI